MIIGGIVLVIVGIMNYSRNRTMALASIIGGAVVGVWGIMNYSRNGGFLRETGIPCCVKRDVNCHCTEYVYKKSEDCETVPCPPLIYTHPTERPNDITVNVSGGINGNGAASALTPLK